MPTGLSACQRWAQLATRQSPGPAFEYSSNHRTIPLLEGRKRVTSAWGSQPQSANTQELPVATMVSVTILGPVLLNARAAAHAFITKLSQ